MIAIPVKCAVILFDISVCEIQTVAVCLAKSLKLDICCKSKQSSQWDSLAKARVSGDKYKHLSSVY